MVANSSVILSNIDFDTYKNTLKQYLKSQSIFQDYDFDGPNISVLLDILSYNTYMNSFYQNMVGNEMFLDSAQLRDSVVSHAKDLNYTPRSFKSAEALVSLSIVSQDTSKTSLLLPKGSSFSSRIFESAFSFIVDQNIIIPEASRTANSVTFAVANVSIFEGSYVTESYPTGGKYVLSNPNVDTNSINVTVVEDTGATTLQYNVAQSLFDLNEDSQVFFVQGAVNESYEIIFGDGVIGRVPKNNSVVIVEYRICSGELPNGASLFKPDGAIDGETAITVSTVAKAASGAISEDIDSIRYNAPRAFTTQERAVTTEDYENLLKTNFSEVNAVSAYGGETIDPPQFGRVFIAVDLNNTDVLPQVNIDKYYQFMKPRTSLGIDPVFVSPEYIYLLVTSDVKYNINVTSINDDDIRTLVTSNILTYAQNNLNNFKRTLRYSRFTNSIDESHVSVISNETEIFPYKIITPAIGVPENVVLTFGFPLQVNNITPVDSIVELESVLYSSRFTYQDQVCILRDDIHGNVNIVTVSNTTVLATIGTVDYTLGKIILTSFAPAAYTNEIKIFVKPLNKDITSLSNTILNIIDSDINLTIEKVRE